VSRALTIIGASARAAASSAARAGFSVYAADLFADVDLRRICQTAIQTPYPEGLSEIVAGPQPGGWMYTGALENHHALVDKLAVLRPLWGNAGSVLREVRDPLRVYAVLRGAGLPAPMVAKGSASLSRDFRWLRKSLHSAGGANVSHWNPQTELPDDSADNYFQEAIDGESCSAVYVADKHSAVMLGVTRQLIGTAWTGASGFRYSGSIGPVALSASAMSQFEAIGIALARAFGLVGVFGVDAVVNADGVWSVEVNPRYTASTELLDSAFGIQAVELHVQACELGTLPQAPGVAEGRCFGKAILFATKGFMVSPELYAQLDAGNGSGRSQFADIPAIGSIVQTGWPIVTILAEGTDELNVLNELRHRALEAKSWWSG